jgi:hypothetical protein
MIPEFLVSYLASDAIGDYLMAGREESGRPIDPGDGSTQPAPPPNPAPVRTIERRDPIRPRDYGTNRPIYIPPPAGGSSPPPGSQETPTDGQSFADRFGRFGVLADLARDLFGAGETGTPQPPIVVGDAGFSGTSGSGNTMLIVLVLAGVGFAGYWFLVRKKQQGGET